MADEALRDLERAVAAAPDDGPARLALAHGLARAGRRLDALDALDLRRVGEASFEEARALAHALWRDALARLAPAWTVDVPLPDLMSVDFDRSGELLLLRSGWRQGDAGGELVVVDAASGAVSTRLEEVRGTRPIQQGAIAVVTTGLVRVRRSGSAWARDEQPHLAGQLRDADPEGERLLVLPNDMRPVVRRWTGARLAEAPRGSPATVDWERGLLVARTAEGLEFVALDGGARGAIPTPETARLTMHRDHVAPGVVAHAGPGLWVAHLERGWTAHLDTSTTAGRFVGPVLAGLDGRSLRLFVDGPPRRFELDLERGPPPGWVPPSPSVYARDPRPARRRGPIHPRADAWALERSAKGAPRAWVETFDGAALADLGRGARPRAWSPDGRTLAVTTGERGRPRLQLWRAS